ncbi:BlaI/MecI/CopY family transcriptional regulator [Actinomycetospora sp. TBRC 11914]|uniref:BlaI/MecI/CopY family transcriptional regulator n=1 Tax=Actinomycetospora sp. TBRC 11914 TaxID=2729387 RepID=UPI00145DFBBF|nr:BlaI/MecI/CopY family transcriptional regulator [Actinomycetospora sp. TBRC 11914]NMO90246.1 BlaI/MecI/CopY family transcriptional regulator [Actinomycetospora sp. TBRC 11914]
MSSPPEEPSTPDRGDRRAPGALEKQVWSVLLAAERPLTTGEVRDQLNAQGPPLAYTTVVTILGRLYAKGLLTRTLDGRAHRYAPASTPEGMAASRMHQALAGEGDHAAVLASFVSDLSDTDEALLRRLLGGNG